jgi:hypothetical protein
MKRVVVVVNKWWECEPVLNTLLNPTATPANFPWPVLARMGPTPGPQQPATTALPRTIFAFNSISVEVCCISDLLMQTTAALPVTGNLATDIFFVQPSFSGS